jgi:GNAT superfamily N-acetyltransferase
MRARVEPVSDNGLRIVPAATLSLGEFADAFTAAFGGYQYPIILDVSRLARRLRHEQYDLEHSLVAYEEDEAVGVAALAVRAETGWCAGLGVVPARRGQGLGRRLFDALVERARGGGLLRLSLEVLVRNTTARRIYEEAGMRVTRDLLILERTTTGGMTEVLTAKQAPPSELLKHFARLHVISPQWSRDLPSLLVKGGMRGLYMGQRTQPDAYALLAEGTDAVTYIFDLAAADAARAREMCAALAAVSAPLKIVNEPEQSLFIAPLIEQGFAEVERQHEMLIEF